MSSPAPVPPLLMEPAIRAALLEDLGGAGDITAMAVLDPGTTMRAELRARADGVAAGLDAAALAFRLVDPAVCLDGPVPEGSPVAPGDTLLTISGPAQAILSAERVALNFAGRMSGIATATRAIAGLIAHTPARVTCTRKTTPGLRLFEKRAVLAGGGVNHRWGLDDAVLIKDNHIAAAGGVAAVLDRLRGRIGHMVTVEIEVDTLDQLGEVLRIGAADCVLLDNMAPDQLREAGAMAAAMGRGRVVLEASGGITPETAAAIAETGVDYLSLGWLTHSAPVLDLGLDTA